MVDMLTTEQHLERAIRRLRERYAPSSVNFYNGTPCWIAPQRTEGTGGYSIFCYRGKHILAHRFSYEAHIGPIPAGYQIDHLCRIKNCVNPAHLQAVTPKENIRRTGNATKTKCNHGHEYTPENTRIDKKGRRTCIECNILYQRALSFIKAMKHELTEPYHHNRETTHCPNGHPYSGDDFRIDGLGSRKCRICNRDAGQRWRDKNRQPKKVITHCPQGHEFTPENSGHYGRARYCKECRRLSNIKTNAAAKAKRDALRLMQHSPQPSA